MSQETLKPQTTVRDYAIKRVLGRGAFGVTYLAEHVSEHVAVAIKEYFPDALAQRDPDGLTVNPSQPSGTTNQDFQSGLEKFLEESRVLGGFDSPHIVRVVDTFELNGTAYMVMQYEAGGTLANYLHAHQTPLEERQILSIFMPVLKGLRTIHAKWLLHRDIKPDNIYIREDGSPLLIDFGTARHALSGKQGGMTEYLTPGYAPPEQYDRSADHGPWTDIYAVGTTMYYCVTRITPFEGRFRSVENDPVMPAVQAAPAFYDQRLLEVIDWMMTPDAQARPQSVDEVLARLEALRVKEPDKVEQAQDELAETMQRAEGAKGHTWPLSSRGDAVEATEMLEEKPTTKPRLPGGAAWWVAGAATVLLLVTVGILLNRVQEPTPDPTSLDTLLETCSGHFDAKPLTTGSSDAARDCYQSVLDQDPGNAQALAGLKRIEDRYVSWARSAVENDDKAKTKTLVSRLEQLNPNNAALPEFKKAFAAWERGERQQERIEAQLQKCQEHFDANRLTTGSGGTARDCYQSVLYQDPGNSQALAGLKRIEDRYVSWARSAAEAGDKAKTKTLVSQLEQLNPDNAALPELQATIAAWEREQTRTARIDARLQQCQAHFEANQLISGASGNAVECYRQVLDEDANNTEALVGLQRVEETLVSWTRSAVENDDKAKTKTLVSRLEQLNPNNAALPEFKKAFAAWEREERQQERIEAQLQQCQEHFDAKRLATGSGGNARDCYQSVLDQDPGNAQALAGLKRIEDRYVSWARSAAEAGDKAKTKTLVSQLEQLNPDNAALPELKATIAAWEREQTRTARIDARLQQCQAHFEANQLISGASGNAVECYRQVLDEDANNTEALVGLQRVEETLVSWTRSAVENDDKAKTKTLVSRLEQLNPNNAALPEFKKAFAAWEREERQQERIEAQLQQCQEHFDAKRLAAGSGGNARDCYQSVLDQDPGNTQALAGLKRIEDRYVSWARSAAEAGDKAKTKTLVSQLEQLNPDNAALPELKATIAAWEREQTRSAKIEARLQQCQEHFDARRLTTGSGGTARDCYQSVLDQDPGNAQALAGLKRVEDTYARWARAALDKGDLRRARMNVDRLRTLNPDHTALSETSERLTALEHKDRALTEDTDAKPKVDEAERRERRLEDLLARAHGALDAGRLAAPAGDNAVVYLNQAAELAPGDSRPREGLTEVVEGYVRRAEEALGRGDPDAAEHALVAARNIAREHHIESSPLDNLAAAIKRERTMLEKQRQERARMEAEMKRLQRQAEELKERERRLREEEETTRPQPPTEEPKKQVVMPPSF